MIAVHIDKNGRYKEVCAYLADSDTPKQIITPAHKGTVNGATGFWSDDESLVESYKSAGVKQVDDKAVDKWLSRPKPEANQDAVKSEAVEDE